jgi:hypothetical protein
VAAPQTGGKEKCPVSQVSFSFWALEEQEQTGSQSLSPPSNKSSLPSAPLFPGLGSHANTAFMWI